MQVLDVPDNLCITAGTLAAFCVAQGLFWIVVGSNQFENVVKDKVEIARLFLDHKSNQSLKVAFCQKLNSLVTSEDLERRRIVQEENVQMIKDRFWGFFFVTFSIFLVSSMLVFYKYRSNIAELIAIDNLKKLSEVRAQRRGFLVGLLLVFFSFSTEIFIFKYIIEPFVIIGDLEIINKIV